jgi:acyl dehydratase
MEKTVALSQEVIESVRKHVGDETVRPLGVVSGLSIRRYARASGESNPLYFNSEYARQLGYPDVIAPPNMLPSIVDWTEGEDESGLRTDGTAGEELAGVPSSGVRVMGGGEDMEFHEPVVAGVEVVLRSRLAEVVERESRSGAMAIVKYRNTYESSAGVPLMTCVRSVLLR